MADLAYENECPVMIDNTVLRSFHCQLLGYGADIVIHSVTWCFGGHGAAIGGLNVASRISRSDNDNFPEKAHYI